MMKIDPRFIKEEGAEIFTGNELLLKGCLETPGGVSVLTGYPGSPIAGFFDAIEAVKELLVAKGVRAVTASNEAISVAMVNGSQMAPVRVLTAFKNVGLHVAADALALGVLSGPHPEGGAVIVCGDDPWSDSTQVPADSRFLARHLRMPMLEPANPQEIKDWIGLGFELSRRANLYVGYMMTTILADGGGTVEVKQNCYPQINILNQIDLVSAAVDVERTVLLPPRTIHRELGVDGRFNTLLELARRLDINRVIEKDTASAGASVGFVTCGMAYNYLEHALHELGMQGQFPIVKLGLSYPMDEMLVSDFFARVDHVVVVEERRSFVEEQVAQLLVKAQQDDPQLRRVKLWGKRFPHGDGIPATRGLNTSLLMEKIATLLESCKMPLSHQGRTRVRKELQLYQQTGATSVDLPSRIPTFCPGCPHRDSSNVLLEIKKSFMDPAYMTRHHGRNEKVDVVFHGDTGCYTMLMFEPNAPLMHNYSGMGLGGATGAGIDALITNKQVVFMGDGTFFHSGMTAISNSIKFGQDLTYIILDNKTTAMTGHQPHSGIEVDLLGNPTFAQDIEKVVAGMAESAGCTIVRINPADREHYRKTLERTILADGVKVIIADKECGITRQRRINAKQRQEQRRTGFLRERSFMNITPEVCEFCLECTRQTGCPGLTIESTDHGPKMQTDLSWCVNDGACARIDACPSFEEVTIKRIRPQRPRGHEIQLENLPEPEIKMDRPVWRAYLAGVGGMGIGVATAILTRAGHRQGYRVLFADKKGLAIRNGGVYSQVTYLQDDVHSSPAIPYGKADLLVGVDLLEAARAVDPSLPVRVASPENTGAVLNTAITPTVPALMGQACLDPLKIESIIRDKTDPKRYFAHSISRLSERLFGTKLYSNIIMIGAAYQRGLVPVSCENLEYAIHSTLGDTDFKKNMRAFNLGRKLVADLEQFTEPSKPRTLARTVRDKATIIEKTRSNGIRRSRAYKFLVYRTLRVCRNLDKGTMSDLAVRIYDMMCYQNWGVADRYAKVVCDVYRSDSVTQHYAATKAVIWNLAKVSIIKDEFYVAHLLTSYEKHRRDHHRYNVNPANGDRISYARTFHPRFFGRKFTIKAPGWSLQVLKRLKFLRKIKWWRAKEKAFCTWYIELIRDFEHRNSTIGSYAHHLAILKAVDEVNGFREYRYPKMEAAQRKVNDLRANPPTTPAHPPVPVGR